MTTPTDQREANAVLGMPSASQNLFSGGLRSLISAGVAWPDRHLANGYTCAHRRYNSRLISSLPPPCTDLLGPTRLTHTSWRAH